MDNNIINFNFEYNKRIGKRYWQFIEDVRIQVLAAGTILDFDFGVLRLLPVENQNAPLAAFSLSDGDLTTTIYIRPHNLYTLGFRSREGIVYEMFETTQHLLPHDSIKPGVADDDLLPDDGYGFIPFISQEQVGRYSFLGKMENAIGSFASPGTKSARALGPSMGFVSQFFVEAIRCRPLQEQYSQLLDGEDPDSCPPSVPLVKIENNWSTLSELAIALQRVSTMDRDLETIITLELRNGRKIQIKTVRQLVKEVLGAALDTRGVVAAA